jgi:predicted MFS family arabinose efflux permease
MHRPGIEPDRPAAESIQVPQKRRVLLVASARFAGAVGAEAALVVGLWGKAAYEFGSEPSGIAALLAGMGVAWFVGSGVAGVAIDRTDPRRVYIAAHLLLMPAALAVIAASSMWQLVMLAAIAELFGAAAFSAVLSIAPFVVESREELRRANATIEIAAKVALIAGAGAGALVVRYAGIDWVFVLYAATGLVAAALLWVVKLRPLDAIDREAVGITEGVRYAYRNPPIRFLLLLPATVWMSFTAFETLEPLFFRDVLGAEPEALGWINMVFGVGLALGSMAAVKLPKTAVSSTGLAVIIAVSSLTSLLFVATADLRVVVAGALVWGTVFGLGEPVLRTLVHVITPRHLLGRVTSAAELHDGAASMLPLAVVPALASVFGVRAVLIGNAILLAVIALATLPHARSVDLEIGAMSERPDPTAFPHRVRPDA